MSKRTGNDVSQGSIRLHGGVPYPGPDELVDAGDIDEPVPHGQFLELAALTHGLKVRREALGLSLTDVSQRSGLTRAAVSRLENGWNINPTLDTLYRYALALNAHVTFGYEAIARDDAGETPASEPGAS